MTTAKDNATLDHDQRIVAHYDTVTDDFYLHDHHHEHIHFGYWDTADIRKACAGFNRHDEHSGALDRMITKVVDPARIESGHQVIDAACGVGGTSRFLARQYGCAVLALDCTPSQIARAKRVTAERSADPDQRIEYRVADVTRAWDVPPDSVDAVVNIETALYYQRRAAFVHEAVRALRPGGHLALQDWMRVDPMTAAEYVEHITPICQHWHGWSLESLGSYQALLERAGLAIEEAEDLAEHVVPNAHLLMRQAARYEETGKWAWSCPALVDT